LRAVGGIAVATEHTLPTQLGDSRCVEAERMQYFRGVLAQSRRGGDTIAAVRRKFDGL
jgi:hypothetical protein